ncbi:MAG: nuclear transport factor 2 family protein [Caulobacteraceae bacterium]
MTEDERSKIEAACIRLQQRYGTLADRQDPAFRELLAEDCVITLPEYPPFVGAEAIMAGQAQWRASGILMRHVVTNGAIEVIDAERARGISYLMVFYGGAQPPSAREVTPINPVSLGEFHDEFVKQDGRWLFKSRVLDRIFRGASPGAQG